MAFTSWRRALELSVASLFACEGYNSGHGIIRVAEHIGVWETVTPECNAQVFPGVYLSYIVGVIFDRECQNWGRGRVPADVVIYNWIASQQLAVDV